MRCLSVISRRRCYIEKEDLFLALTIFFAKRKNIQGSIEVWEKELASFIGVSDALAVNSGRGGMQLIFRSLNLSAQDEIIIPAYTLVDLVKIIKSMGFVPVPVDIDPKTFNINLVEVKNRITERTKVILATHIFGVPCEIDKILELARPKSIIVVEDCAHSVGSKFKGKMTGSLADASFFSFETIKPINTYGGGAVLTNNKELAKKMRNLHKDSIKRQSMPKSIPLGKLLSAFFENIFLSTLFSLPFLYLLASPRYSSKIYDFYRKLQKPRSPSSGYSDFQAFLGIRKLNTLKDRIAKRKEKVDYFISLFVNKVTPQHLEGHSNANYYFFIALIEKDTTSFRKALLSKGIDVGIKSEIADDCASFLGYDDCPEAKRIYNQAIQIPLHEGVSFDDIRYIAKYLKELL